MDRARHQKNLSISSEERARAVRKMHGEKKKVTSTHQSANALSADAGLVLPNIRPGMRYEPAMAGR